MNRLRFFALTSGPVVAGLLFSQIAGAIAVPVSCPGTAPTTDREFTVTTDPGTATCLATGTGNINGNNDAINQLGYLTLDKSDDLISGLQPGSLTTTLPTSGLSGSFSFNAPGFQNFIIAFKSGEGVLDPDWAAFALPAGVTSGTWAISGNQELSHANLYGQIVPVPAGIWLLGTGVIALGARKMRRAASPTPA